MKSLLFSLLLLTSCATVQKLTPPTADVAMQTEVRNGMLKTNTLYTLIIQQSDKSFSAYQNTYAEIAADIADIKSKDMARPHGENLVKLVTNLEEAFNKYKEIHRSSGALTNGQALSFNEALKGYWSPLLNSEMQLK